MDTLPCVLLIDFSALFRRAWHVGSEMSHAYEATISGVNRAEAKFPDCLVAICCDARGNWRKDLYKEYKAKRDQQPESMYGEIRRTEERLISDGRLLWKFEGFEADDVIATATKRALDAGHEVIIASHDKDLMQLLNVRVSFLATHLTPWEVVGPEKVREKFGVDPEQLGDFLALAGDKSDNVPGCPGVGEVNAADILNKRKDLAGIWEALDPPPGKNPIAFSTPNIMKKLRENFKQIEMSRTLVGFKDAPLRFADIYDKREQLPLCKEETTMEEDADKILAQESLKDLETTGKTPDGTTTAVGTVASCPPEATVIETELAPIEYHRQLEPKSFSQTLICAQVMYNSRMYGKYPSYQAQAVAILRGREMGYGAACALDLFHVMKDKGGNLSLALHAHVIADRAKRDENCEYFMCVHTDSESATYKTKHKKDPTYTELTYTIQEAEQAGLTKPAQSGAPSNWVKIPGPMLRKMCAVQLARIVYPGASMGLYAVEEMEGIE